MQLALLQVCRGRCIHRPVLGHTHAPPPPPSFLKLFGLSVLLSCLAVSMMHQQAATSHYNSAQGGSQHYQGQAPIAMMGQGGQGSSMMGQRPMAPYRPSQQGKAEACFCPW